MYRDPDLSGYSGCRHPAPLLGGATTAGPPASPEDAAASLATRPLETVAVAQTSHARSTPGAPRPREPPRGRVPRPARSASVLVNADSAAWRAHVDAALDPRFERAFAILDALHAERQRPDDARRAAHVLQLRRELARFLAVLDGHRTPPDPRGAG